MEEADARFEECLEVITKALTSDKPWSHQGTHWRFDQVVVEPPSAQKPHPPIWMGAGSPESIKQVAARGFNLLLGQFDSLEKISQGIALFKTEVKSRGRKFEPMSVAVARSVNIVDSASEYEKAIETRMAGRRRTQQLARRPNFRDTREAAEAGTLDGSPEEVSAKLHALRDVGVEYVLLNSPAGLPTLRRFAQEVMPGFVSDAQMATSSDRTS